MPVFLPRLLVACALVATASCAVAQAPATATTPAQVPLASFFDNAEFTGAQLSPNAASLAVRFGGKGVGDRLAVINLSTNTIKIVAKFSEGDVGDFQWVNDERLVFNSHDKRIADGELHIGPGLYAVNRDGSDFRQLASVSPYMTQERSAARTMLPINTFLVQQVGKQDSDNVYVYVPTYTDTGELQHINLLQLDTKNGHSTTVERPAEFQGWLLDHAGEPRLGIAYDKGMEAIWYRDPRANNSWRKLTEFDSYKGGRGAFGPLAFAPDGTLYVNINIGSDKRSLHVYDFAKNEVKRDAVIALQDFDFAGNLVTSNDKLLGFHYLSDAESTVWLDATMKAVQADVDKALPATVNIITVAARPTTPWVLVQSYSDAQPRRYALYNTATKAFNPVGESRPAIDARLMGTQELVRYKARVGLTIPAWLTLPHASTRKNLPMIVLVHGGPYVRGNAWGWNPDAQFLASRGYAVLEPEFRGSEGFGVRHAKAGWKQWGLAMQNDIADGTRWAVAQGIADGKRVCIAGASYGGYAVLMGLVNDPDLYQCGVDWVGVTDIKLMYTGDWSASSDTSEAYKRYGMPVLIGDLVKDAAQLKATSPLEQAARIKAPLLLAYGGNDVRVPIYHGKKFYDAVKATNSDVEWIVYGNEGHGWRLPENRIDFWGRVEKFLDRHIGH